MPIGVSKNTNAVGILGVVFVLIALLELSSYVLLRVLTSKSVVFDRQNITQDYGEYLAARNLQLGWLNKDADNHGARRDSSGFAREGPCVDVYGDSFTYGNEVRDEEAWPSLLSARMRCRVRNFGVNGYGTDQAFIRYRAARNPAPVVALNHFSEGIIRNVNQFNNYIYPNFEYAFKPRFVLNSGSLELVETPIIPRNELEEFFSKPAAYLTNEYFLPGGSSGVQLARFPYLLNVMRMPEHWNIKPRFSRQNPHAQFYSSEHPSGGLEVTLRIMTDFVDDGFKKGILPIVTIIPSCRDFEHHARYGEFAYGALSNALRKTGAIFIDFGTEVLKRERSYQSLYYSCSRHMNPDGNVLMAEIFSEYLQKLPVLSKNSSSTR